VNDIFGGSDGDRQRKQKRASAFALTLSGPLPHLLTLTLQHYYTKPIDIDPK